MKFSKIAAHVAAVAVLTGVVVALSVPAEAAKKRKRSYIYYGQEDRQAVRTARSGTRITVRRRSFLDPGTETKGYDEHYTDYAFQPGYNTPPGLDRNDPTVSFNRMPFNDPFDMPGRKF